MDRDATKIHSTIENQAQFDERVTEHQMLMDKAMGALFHNVAANYHRMIGTPKEPGLMTRRDMNIQPEGAVPGTRGPAIVLGSGPSLDEALSYIPDILKAHDGSRLFCSPSQMWSLFREDIIPDYVLVHDPYLGPNARYISLDAWNDGLKRFPRSTLEAPVMVSHVAAPGDTLTWPMFELTGQLFIEEYAYPEFWDPKIRPRVVVSGYEGVEQASLFAYTVGDDWFDEHVKPIEHKIVNGPNTTQQLIHLAAYLGFAPVYAIGFDLCHWKDKLRFKTDFPDGHESTVPQVPSDATVFKPDDCPFTTQTDMYLGKKTAIRFAWEQQPLMPLVEVVVDGTPGALEIFPRIGIEELAKGGRRKVDLGALQAKALHTCIEREWGLTLEKAVMRFGAHQLPAITRDQFSHEINVVEAKQEMRANLEQAFVEADNGRKPRIKAPSLGDIKAFGTSARGIEGIE